MSWNANLIVLDGDASCGVAFLAYLVGLFSSRKWHGFVGGIEQEMWQDG